MARPFDTRSPPRFTQRMTNTPTTADLPTPPVAVRREHSFTTHGTTITDPYAWLKDPNYPEVTDADILAYMAEGNAYFEASMPVASVPALH